MTGTCRYVAPVRRVSLLLAVAALVASPARADTFTVVPSAAAAPTPLAPARTTVQQVRALFARNDRARVPRKAVAAFVPL